MPPDRYYETIQIISRNKVKYFFEGEGETIMLKFNI